MSETLLLMHGTSAEKLAKIMASGHLHAESCLTNCTETALHYAAVNAEDDESEPVILMVQAPCDSLKVDQSSFHFPLWNTTLKRAGVLTDAGMDWDAYDQFIRSSTPDMSYQTSLEKVSAVKCSCKIAINQIVEVKNPVSLPQQ